MTGNRSDQSSELVDAVTFLPDLTSVGGALSLLATVQYPHSEQQRRIQDKRLRHSGTIHEQVKDTCITKLTVYFSFTLLFMSGLDESLVVGSGSLTRMT